ncbi:hypothetical protein FBU30_002910 [Linnemannia zychae]|nr:hypothetical protein FBU30_002910 [Linnemannia zychae]
MTSLPPHVDSLPHPTPPSYTSSKRPELTPMGQSVLANLEGAATETCELPTIRRGLAAAYLGMANVLSLLGHNFANHSHNRDVKEQQLGNVNPDLPTSWLETKSSRCRSRITTKSTNDKIQASANQQQRPPTLMPMPLEIERPLIPPQDVSKSELDIYTLGSQRMTESNLSVYVPLMAKPGLFASDETASSLMDMAKNFLVSDCQVMLILGESGSGKSTFIRQLEYKLWQEYNTSSRIPLFINLLAMEEPENDLITKQLGIYGFSEPQIEFLQQQRQFTLICDGYDESQLKCNLHTTNFLNRSGQYDAKVIITCRTQYLGPNYWDWIMPLRTVGRHGYAADNLFRECVIVPFSEAQIEDYVEQYVPLEQKVLPSIVQGNSNLSKLHVSRIQLPKRSTDLIEPPSYSDSQGITFLIEDHPLLQHNLVAEPTVVQFLAERVRLDSDFKQYLLYIIEQSKSDKHIERAAANAITILVKAGVRFNGQDLRGIHIAGADLSGGEFDSAQLQGADLTDVNFTKSWIRQANFTNALMTRVRFGGLPHLKLQDCAYSCAYSPDGKILAVGVQRGKIIIYDTESWAPIQTLEDDMPTANILCLAFSPTGDQILSGNNNKTVRLWRCATKSVDFVLRGHTCPVTTVAFSPCGKQLASSGEDKTIRLWDTASGAATFVLADHYSSIFDIAYSPDGARIASASFDGTIRIFDTQTGQSKLVMECGDGSAKCITYSPDGTIIFTGHRHGIIQSWDPNIHRKDQRWNGLGHEIRRIAFSPNEQWIALCDSGNNVKLWSTHEKKLASSLPNRSYGIKDVVFSPNGLQMASPSVDRTVRLWDLSDAELIPSKKTHYYPLKHVVYSSDGQFIVAGRASSDVQLYNAFSGELLQSIPYSSRWIKGKGYAFAAAFSPCGRWLATSNNNPCSINIWEACSGAHVRKLIGHTVPAADIQYSPDGRQIVSVTREGEIRIWDVNSGKSKELQARVHASGTERTVGFSPIRMQVTESCFVPCIVRIWDQPSNQPRHILKHKKAVICFAWSSCERWIATGCVDFIDSINDHGCVNAVWLWSSSQEKSDIEWTCTLAIHSFELSVCSIAWKPNSLEFVTGGKDGSIQVWRLVESSGEWSARLVWNIGDSSLICSKAIFSNAIDLSPTNRQLLEQRDYLVY